MRYLVINIKCKRDIAILLQLYCNLIRGRVNWKADKRGKRETAKINE